MISDEKLIQILEEFERRRSEPVDPYPRTILDQMMDEIYREMNEAFLSKIFSIPDSKESDGEETTGR